MEPLVAASSGAPAQPDVDFFEMMEPLDVTSKLPAKFDELLESKKWQERIEAVELISSQLDPPSRVLPSDKLSTVIKAFIKVIEKDVNINVSAAAAKALRSLALGMRTAFALFVPRVMSVSFEKLKEKKAALREPLNELLDAASYTVSLAAYTAQLEEGLTNKNPQSRLQSALFLARLLSCHDSTTIPLEAVKAIGPACIKISNDSDGEVRGAAFQAIAAVWRCVGEVAAKRLFADVANDKLKMDKIMECYSKLVEEKGERGASIEMLRLHTNYKSMPGVGPRGAETQASSGDVAAASAATPLDVDPWDLLDPVDVTTKLGSNFDELLASKKWQERIEAINLLSSQLEPPPKIRPSDRLTDVIKSLIKVVEKDLNINVGAAAAKALTGTAQGLRTGFAPFAQKTMSIALDKLKEKKVTLRDPLNVMLDAVALTTPCTQFVEQVSEGLCSKNPQSRHQTALFLARYLSLHDLSTLPLEAVKGLTPAFLKATSDADGEVRNATLQAIAAIWRCIGEAAIRKVFNEIADDKIKMDKLTECYTKLIEEKGANGAAPEIRRLHTNTGGSKSNVAVQNVPKSVRPTPSARPSSSSSARVTSAGVVRKPAPGGQKLAAQANPKPTPVPRVATAQPRVTSTQFRLPSRPFTATHSMAPISRPGQPVVNALSNANRPNIVRTQRPVVGVKKTDVRQPVPVRVTQQNGTTLPGQVDTALGVRPQPVVATAVSALPRMPRERSDLQKGTRSTSIPRPSGIKPPSTAVIRASGAATDQSGLRPPTVGLARK